jgi:hypothetical protein
VILNTTHARLLRLAVVMKVRALGVWFWIAFLALVVVSAIQEPMGLQDSLGVVWPGSGAAAGVGAAALFTIGRNMAGAFTLASANLVILGFVATAAVGVAWLADAARGRFVSVVDLGAGWLMFVLAWLPAAIVFAAMRSRDLLTLVATPAATLVAILVSVAQRSPGPDAAMPAAVIALAVTGAFCFLRSGVLRNPI